MRNPPSITVLIADNHPIFLRGVRSILDKAPAILKVVAEAHDGAQAWQQIQTLRPTVAILDLDMPQLDGLQIARRVFLQKIPVRLIILTMHKSPDFFRQAMALGVLGYLVKDDMTTNIVDCVQNVVAGRHFIAPAFSTFLAEADAAAPAGSPGAPLSNLTQTQCEVLKLLARGLTSKEMAVELGISFRTVENHRFRIAEKLGLKGNHNLLRFAVENKGRF
ncbi:MAG: response regulator transcription factor [Pedosphaera parvula]|nr:response regulator transcription factor [Pedosphaera parvula]